MSLFSKLFKRDTGGKSAEGDKKKELKQASSPQKVAKKPAQTASKVSHNETPKPSRKRRRPKRRRNDNAKENWSLEQFVVEPQKGKTRFHDLELPLPLMRAVHAQGFQYCSPIQAQILPHSLDGYDAVGKAQTGTGKTAAFLITAITELLNNPFDDERFLAEPRVVILAPTRELVVQIGEDAKQLVKYSELRVETLIGGVDFQKQLDRIQKRVVDIVIATPGRLIDFITRQQISLDLVEILVLDEADRMLDMGFLPQVRRIVRATPHKDQRQTLLFSATFNYDINNMIENWMVDPVRVEIEPENIAAKTVEQKVYMVGSEEKYTVLKNIISQDDVKSVIVFANRRDQSRTLFEKLKAQGISCGILSGEVSQKSRMRALDNFKTGKMKVLVATDVAGRGIHVDDVSHVINYNLPDDPEDYVHRIGRTGRAGAKGVSISLVCEDDAFALPNIETLLNDKLECVQPPHSLLQ